MTEPKFVLLHADGTETSGDSISEVVDKLLPEHAVLPETEDGEKDRLVLRHDALVLLANQAQAVVAAACAEEGKLGRLDEDELTILFHDRAAETVELGVWESEVPLFLLSSSFAPFTRTPAPEGESIVFLDPSNERTFVDSIVKAGAAELFTRNETAEEIDAAFS